MIKQTYINMERNMKKARHLIEVGVLTLAYLATFSSAKAADKVLFSSLVQDGNPVQREFHLLHGENEGIFVEYRDDALVIEAEPQNNGFGEARAEGSFTDEGQKPVVYSFKYEIQHGPVLHLTMWIRLDPHQEISTHGYGITFYRDGGKGLIGISRTPADSGPVNWEADCNDLLSPGVKEAKIFVKNTEEGVSLKVEVNGIIVLSGLDEGKDSIKEGSGVAFRAHDNGSNAGFAVAITDVEVREE